MNRKRQNTKTPKPHRDARSEDAISFAQQAGKIIEEIEALVNEVSSTDQPQFRPLTPDPSPPKKRGRGEPGMLVFFVRDAE